MGKVNDLPDQVNGNGVRANHHEEESPLLQSEDIDDRVEQGQQQEAPAAGPEDERASPDILDDRELKSLRYLGIRSPGLAQYLAQRTTAPEIAQAKADAAGNDQPHQLEPLRALRAQPFARQNAEQGRADGGNGRQETLVIAV